MDENDFIAAIINNDADTVAQGLEEGIDANFTLDGDGITPLHFAAQNNALESAVLLITAGARMDNKTVDGQTPLEIAIEHRHPEMIKLLRVFEQQPRNVLDPKDKAH